MYPAAVAEALRASGIDAGTVGDLRLGGASDAERFAAVVAGGFCVLTETENVGDFARIAAEHSTGRGHHPGLLIALSSHSRRPTGLQPLVDGSEPSPTNNSRTGSSTPSRAPAGCSRVEYPHSGQTSRRRRSATETTTRSVKNCT
ncbi:MAG: hypothetical protein ACRDMX_12950 [Solirubrobacteraceae bacterium]